MRYYPPSRNLSPNLVLVEGKTLGLPLCKTRLCGEENCLAEEKPHVPRQPSSPLPWALWPAFLYATPREGGGPTPLSSPPLFGGP